MNKKMTDDQMIQFSGTLYAIDEGFKNRALENIKTRMGLKSLDIKNPEIKPK